MKRVVPTPKRGTSILEKIEFYHNLIDEGLDVEELKVVRNRIYKLKHDDNSGDEDFAINHILECIKEFLE
ncbi:MAG: hypothetical protein NC310_00450 [Roseburia sp.]|nr:hypothetical protein [Anaeroplasma bactoclasticum]MCM1195522.1 hypothetical protein [Roseburia sp.]MCM1556898.1 hypothetical protein [Anaeroplasma bactoclasticum]